MNREDSFTPLRIPGSKPQARLHLHPDPDPLSESIRAQGVWEPFETEVFLGLLRPGDAVVDVGANVGYYTVLAGLAVGAAGIVHALEPDPGNLALLRRNVALNGLGNVMVHAIAASDRTGRAALYQDPANRGDHRLYASTAEPRSNVPVETRSLDAQLAVQHGIRLIKIDAQGSELRIFRGMANLLAHRSPELRIITEVWPYGLRESGSSHEALLALMQGHGLGASRIDEAAGRLEPLGYDALAALLRTPWYADQRGFVNLLLE